MHHLASVNCTMITNKRMPECKRFKSPIIVILIYAKGKTNLSFEDSRQISWQLHSLRLVIQSGYGNSRDASISIILLDTRCPGSNVMLSTRNDISVYLVASNRFHYICVYIQTNFCKVFFVSNRLFHTFLYVLCSTVIPRRICLSRSELYIYIYNLEIFKLL